MAARPKIIAIVLIFTLALSLRLWKLNEAGRTWDEEAYVVSGYKHVELLKNGDLSNPYWYEWPDHPPVAKYLYGFAANFDYREKNMDGRPVFEYDWTYTRMVSVIFSSLTAVLILLIGWRFFSPFTGVSAGIVFSTLPFFLGLSQLVTIESILIFFYTATIYTFLLFLEKYSAKRLILCGVTLGLCLGVKFTSLLILPLMVTIYAIWRMKEGKKKKPKLYHLLSVITLGVIIFTALWPALWFNAQKTLEGIISLRFGSTAPTTELFFGKIGPTTPLYYPVYLLITTPVIILALMFTGVWRSFKKPGWIALSVIVWLIIPFLVSFQHLRQNGIRYMIEIYGPVSLLAAYGLEALKNRFANLNKANVIFVALLISYMMFNVMMIAPYYLNYFNILVGGAANVYHNKLFHMGWWGEGQREAVNYLVKNASRDNVIGVNVVPIYVMPPVEGLRMAIYKDDLEYHYVITNSLAEIRGQVNEELLNKKYNLVYSVNAGGAPIVKVFKHK